VTAARFRACSGQSKGKRQWGVCAGWDDTFLPLWWRLLDAKGRTRLFASREAAERVAARLCYQEVCHEMARAAAVNLRAYLADCAKVPGARRPYPGIVADLRRRDPFGLYNSSM
jgi:hypothetical protein